MIFIFRGRKRTEVGSQPQTNGQIEQPVPERQTQAAANTAEELTDTGAWKTNDFFS